MKVLITGGAGFIGSHVAEHFFEIGNEVYIIDNLSSGYRENIGFIDDEHFFELDIRDYNKVNELIVKHQFDVVVHLAAMVSVVETVEKPVESNEINIDATLNILQVCKENNKNIKKFVFASSAAVYGNEKTLPKSIESFIQPESPYAVQKYSGEQYVKIYNQLYGIPTTALRFFNVYGPKQDPKSQYSGVLSVLKNAFDQNKTFTFYGDGRQTRDFVYVKDVVQAINLVVNEDGSNGKVYNVGTSKPTSLIEIFDVFKNLYNKTIDTAFDKPREGDVKQSYANIDGLEELGYKIKYPIAKGLNEYLSYKSSK
ncbi:NAD-dependent epimerase/dehydratase family protein [Staphylococcus felis]|uniref:NAD-dependent epimerase/dehydratase family protein n=1 Tax=Staphylococcus felis TaxID=46127 RepID=UPI000E26C890|nr:NAD-dependent epimerase/dehydratase family protein [Staphylococcus felis]REH84820.1 NAD-dependent dehydratase [Staphylococcus felis]